MSLNKKNSIISVSNLTYQTHGSEVISDFSFEIPEGAYVGIIGPNGGGKTTLLRLILGLIKPSKGTIKILGRDISDSSVRKHIGYVAQRGGNLDPLFPASVEEVVRSGRTPRSGLLSSCNKSDEEVVQKVMSHLGIQKLAKRPLGRLSGGERQKVLLARAMAGEPKILCLDEPVDGLDPLSRTEFYELLRHIHGEGVTILFVSHDVHTIAKEADSAICLKHDLVCHGAEACHIGKGDMHDLYHADRTDMLKHHGE